MSDYLPDHKLQGSYSRDFAKNFTDRDLYIIDKALYCVKDLAPDGFVVIDYHKLQKMVGGEKYRSTLEAWNKVKKKLAETAAEIDSVIAANRREKQEGAEEDPENDDMGNGLKVRDEAVRALIKRKAAEMSKAANTPDDDSDADSDSPGLEIAPRVAPQEEDDDSDAGGDVESASKEAKKAHKSHASMEQTAENQGTRVLTFGRMEVEEAEEVEGVEDVEEVEEAEEFDMNQANQQAPLEWNETAQRRFDTSLGTDSVPMFRPEPLPLPPASWGPFGTGPVDYGDDDHPSLWHNQ
ncbi:hypothetical protein GGR51DRAFT_556856 [Nemania sp. FL0031]|nr:hypothetical protein GGR51DRAFT_556856 [Nemania sp. FL0031]